MAFALSMGNPFGYAYPGSLVPYTDTTGRTTTSAALDPQERTFIAIIHGQSLASNHIPDAYTVTNATKVQSVNWAGDRLLYRHKEPCFGGSYYVAGEIPGNNWNFPYISLWGMVGDLLIDQGTFDRVIWMNVSAGGQSVSAFEPGGALFQRIPNAFHIFRTLGISGNQVTAMLSKIGESDGALNTPAEEYKASVRATARVARSYGFTGPWFIPQETFSNSGTDTAIRQAQAELSAEAGYVLGPDFDALGSEYRDSGHVHQNAAGHAAMAQMWADCIGEHFA